MVREYELMFIVRPELDEEGVQTAVDSVRTLIESQDGSVLKTTMWGKRRLAYEVKRLRDGYYVIFKLTLDGTKVPEIERALRIHDTVFRHMLVVDEIGTTEEEVAAEAASLAAASAAASDVAGEADEESADEESKESTEPVAVGVGAEDDDVADGGDDDEEEN